MKKAIISILAAAMLLVSAPAVIASTPSAESKPAPTVVKPESSNPDAVAVLKDKAGKELVAILPEDIKITGSADVSKIADPVAKKEMQEAVAEVKKAKSVADILPKIDTVIKEYTSIDKVEDLAIVNITHIDIADDVKEALKANPNATVDLIFDLNVSAKEEIIVLHKDSVKGWVALAKENVINNGDGTITAKFDGFSPVAFVKNTNVVKSQKLGVETHVAELSLVAVTLLGLSTLCFVSYKKASAK